MAASFPRGSARFAAQVGIFLLGTAATYVSLALLVLLGRFLDAAGSDFRVVTIEITKLGASVAGGLALARFAAWRLFRGGRGESDSRTLGIPAGRIRPLRWVVGLVVAAYLVTWLFGVPTVQSSLENQALNTYKELEARNHGPEWQRYPFIRTFFAVPLLPSVVLTYHEYQLAGLHGWGGWQVHVWYPGHIRKVGARMAWIS